MNKVKISWQKGLAFEVEQDNHVFQIDGPADFGGQNKGPQPKALVLTALAGCSGMDAVSILQKMRIPEFDLEIEVIATLEEEHPKVYTHIDLIFNFTGEDLPIDKLKRAVELSLERYCAVYAMLVKVVEIKDIIRLNGKEV
ncbi:MAG: OsmC family protein [Candidatus Cloacimonas sp.]|nr:OsmC family protein [Candidatus Cloacimonadota bacterium]